MSELGKYQIRCDHCGRFMVPDTHGTAWEACGEFGEETRWICRPCVQKPNFILMAGNGLNDPRWCGVVTPQTVEQ